MGRTQLAEEVVSIEDVLVAVDVHAGRGEGIPNDQLVFADLQLALVLLSPEVVLLHLGKLGPEGGRVGALVGGRASLDGGERAG